MQKADSLKEISSNGQQLTHAISQVELLIQLLSQTISIPQPILDFKTQLLGLYGDMQCFRSFHLRYTLERSYFGFLSYVSSLVNLFKQVFANNHKDGKYNYAAIFQDLQKGESSQDFSNLKGKFEMLRNIYNQIAGQNFSNLPNYIYITFNEKKGFKLWNELFPQNFEVSNLHFAEKYSQKCGVESRKILQIISLLDNANDKRVDIYQFINFVEEFSDFLDEEGLICSEQVQHFQTEIEKKTRAMNSPPKKIGESEWLFKSGMKYTGELDANHRKIGKGFLQEEDYEFEGEFFNDLPINFGIENRKNVKYEGYFLNGLYHGSGKLVFPNGRQYEGNFENHQFHGFGVLVGDDGIKYEGEWKNGSLEEGKIVYHDGSYYQGKLFNSFFKNGKGQLVVNKLSLSSNESQNSTKLMYIDGQFENDAPLNAKVFNLLLDSVCYEGELSNWCFTGKGKRIYIDGTYEGELLRDKKNGSGTSFYKNGDKFVGEWLEDLQVNGKYSYNKDSNNYYEGEWRNGVMEGYGKFSYVSGGTYQGQVKEGKRSGKGIYKYANGNYYEGQWVSNNQQGEGKFVYCNGPNGEGGDIYQGQFKKGKFHGFGHYYYRKSGKQYIGFWEDDKWNGLGKFLNSEGKVIKSGLWLNDKLVSEKDPQEIKIDQQYEHLILKIQHNNVPAQN